MSLDIALQRLRSEVDPAYLEEIAATAAYLARTGVPSRAKRHGEAAPDFALATSDDEVVVLDELLRQGPVILSFLRSASCPFCVARLQALVASGAEVAAAGCSLVMLLPGTPCGALSARLARLPEAHALHDPDLGVALRYGLVYLSPPGSTPEMERRLFAMPADYVVSDDGRIVLAHVSPDVTQRLTLNALIAAARQLRTNGQGHK
jgi:peroxiredoxin